MWMFQNSCFQLLNFSVFIYKHFISQNGFIDTEIEFRILDLWVSKHVGHLTKLQKKNLACEKKRDMSFEWLTNLTNKRSYFPYSLAIYRYLFLAFQFTVREKWHWIFWTSNCYAFTSSDFAHIFKFNFQNTQSTLDIIMILIWSDFTFLLSKYQHTKQ